MRWVFILVSSIFVASQAFAAIVVTTVEGASNQTIVNPLATTATGVGTSSVTTIFGGSGGTSCFGVSGYPQNSDGTCSSCVGVGRGGTCNLRRIDPNISLKITFYSTTLTQPAIPKVRLSDNSVAINTATATFSPVSRGQSTTLVIPWSELCALAGDGNCSISGPVTLLIGFDIYGSADGFSDAGEDSTTVQVVVVAPASGEGDQEYCDTYPNSVAGSGICNWEAFPGDGKVFLKNPLPAQSFPNLTSISGTSVQVAGLLMFYSSVSFDDVTPSSLFKRFNLQTSTTGNTTSTGGAVNVVGKFSEGFDNFTTYFIRMATVDQAQNVGFMTTNAAIDASPCGAGAALLTSGTVNPSIDRTCPFIVTPDPVYGLLTKDFNCFIASAAYGSGLHPKLNTFRQFRSAILLKSEWGRNLNQRYYKYGPYGARFLNDHPTLKPVVRLALWPMWLLLEMILNFGPLPIGFGLMVLTLVSVWAVSRARRRETIVA